jgi:hypothetical protein
MADHPVTTTPSRGPTRLLTDNATEPRQGVIFEFRAVDVQAQPHEIVTDGGDERGVRAARRFRPAAAAALRSWKRVRRPVLFRRLVGIGPDPSTKDAELIAFRVGEYHPRRVTLPDIGPPSTEGKEAFDFCGLIDWTEVGMESVLACLLLRNWHEQQARHPIRSRPDLELVHGVAHDNPAQGLRPPSTKRDRILSVDDDLLPNEIHAAHSARSVSQADRHSAPVRRRGQFRALRDADLPYDPRARTSR